MIVANVVYVFSDSDINSFGLVSLFLATPAPTTVYPQFPTVINFTTSNNSTNLAWIAAIIVPVAIILGLIPCWILLCVSFMMIECQIMCIGSEVIYDSRDVLSIDLPFKLGL